jgi:uncharacterized membrane protein YdbT with pleckstrin-like domain
MWALAALMPPVFYLVFSGIFSSWLTNEYIYPIVVLFLSIYYLYVWLLAFHSFVDYYLDVWIVTTERIINIEQKGLFARTVSEQELFRVQDVTSEVHGFFETILNFGDVHIQTAGQIQRFIFKQVPQPSKIVQEVIQLSEKNKRHHRIMEEKEKMAIQNNT